MDIYTINGYIFGNGPAFQACDGETIHWHVISLGAEIDIHSIRFHGQTLVYHKHRVNQFQVIAANFRAADMVATEPGRWMINCQTTDHVTAGMVTFLDVQQCSNAVPDDNPQDSSGSHRSYYIAAVEEEWDYGPTGMNNYHGGRLDAAHSNSAKYFSVQNNFIGGKYKKAIFKAFTDARFSDVIRRKDSELHMGYLGPVIRVEVGDTVTVHFWNNATRPYSIACSGLRIDKNNEGYLYYVNGSDEYGVPVLPGNKRVYNWSVPADVGPADDDPDCIIQRYHSAVSVVRDVFSGLIGPILICRKDALSENGKQISSDKEFVLLFSVTDENLSWYIDENIRTYSNNGSMVDKSNADFQESNRMHAINGRSYANLDGLDMCVGDTVAWHIMSVGSHRNLHTITFYGQTVSNSRNRIQSVSLLGTEFQTVTMKPDNVGSWALVCNTIEHHIAGEQALFVVNACNRSTELSPIVNGRVRTYYIAAHEQDWDYGEIEGTQRHVEKKALYREFTDATFSQVKIRTEHEIHLGSLGPLIKAEVGDVIEVIFKNNASRPYSLHADGLYYGKSDEGAWYGADGEPKAGDKVMPGGYHIYHWYVPQRTGPETSDPNCIIRPYYSAVNPTRDSQSGLVGAIKVCRQGVLDEIGERKDVDREFVLFFTYAHEREGWYATPDSADYNTINGYQFFNTKGLIMNEGDRVAWYMFSFGNEKNLHAIHFHGHAFTYYSDRHHRDDVINVLPGNAVTIEMFAKEPGTWLLHCHTTEHIKYGMITTYTVRKKEPKPDPLTTPTINSAKRIAAVSWFLALDILLLEKLM